MRSNPLPASSLALLGLALLALSQGAPAQTGNTGQVSPTAITTAKPGAVVKWMICTSGTFPSSGTQATDVPYVSEVRLFAGDATPPNWLPCNGQLLPRAQNAALAALLGTAFGGDGVTTFGLPDLRGRVPIGTGSGPGLTPRNLGDKGGGDSVVLGVTNLPSHLHTISSGSTGLTGGGVAVTNMPPFLALNVSLEDGSNQNLGVIRWMAGTVVPGIPCNGQVVQITSNIALFSVIGTIYGGNGQTTMAIPDLRGRIPFGRDGGPGLTQRFIGESGGSESHAISVPEMPAHTHTYSGGTTGSTGGGASPADAMPPYLVLTTGIATSGIYNTVDNSGNGTPAVGEMHLTAANREQNSYFVACDSSLLNASDYDVLAFAIGNAWGGDGTNTIAVPDLRGRTVYHYSNAAFQTPASIGSRFGGEKFPTLTSVNLPAHAHSIAGLNPPSTPVDANGAANNVAEGAANGSPVGVTALSSPGSGGSVTYSLTGDTSGGGFTISSTTGVVTVADATKLDYETSGARTRSPSGPRRTATLAHRLLPSR